MRRGKASSTAQAVMRERAKGMTPRASDPRYVAVELETDDLAERLAAAGHDRSRPTFWLWDWRTAVIARLLALSLALYGCSSRTPTAPSGSNPAPSANAARVLMLTATAGFRHDSIATARQVLANLAASSREFTVTATEDLGAFNAASLANYDVLFFANTSGELAFTADQKAAIVSFVSNGRGFLGTHSATDTLYEWEDYGRLVGAYFKEHPWTQQGGVIVEDAAHPAATGIGDRFSLVEEFYTFRENPRSRVQVLLRLDAASVGSTGDYPLAWAHTFGAGRAYYNALGHCSETWNDARFQRQLLGAIRWAAAR